MKLIHTVLGGGGDTARLLALASLLALLAAALLPLAPAAADGHPDSLGLELALSLDDDSDNIVQAGSEITVKAELRFPWQRATAPPAELPSYTAYSLDVPAASVAASNLRISGNLEWDSAGRRRFDIPAHSPLNSDLPWPPVTNQLMIKGLDGRTLIARDNRTRIHIYDSYTLEYKTTLAPPPGADTHHNSGFGASVAYNSRSFGAWFGKAIAVWHETEDRAWLFVGSWGDTVESHGGMGRLYIYRLDWDGDSVTATQEAALAPTLAEANNRHGTAVAHYGAAVDLSRDGGTLAVSATRMNVMGAVYVYTRPDGAGEDWGDITYADGVKVTVGAVPSFGTTQSNMPFLPNTAYSASNPRSCGDWCAMVWSSVATSGYDGVDLGAQRVSLSADGSVLLVGAGEKEHPVTRPYSSGNRKDNAGEAFVWVAPEGGWANAPRADLDANGNAKTLIAAKTDATAFRRATHYSPGPLRRVTEPAAVLVAADWPNPGNGYFGLDAVISPDGSTAVVAGDLVHVFQRDSASDWASANGGYRGYLAPSATLGNTGEAASATMQFSFDGSELAIGLVAHSSPSWRVGAIRVFSRPEDGTWASTSASRLLQERDGVRSGSARYGNVVPELTGRRVAIGTQAAGRNYLNTLTARRCTLRTLDGITTATCPIYLPNSTIIIPEGTPDGPVSIQATVALRLAATTREMPTTVTLSDTLELTVGEVDELTEVEFDFATDTRGDSDSSNDRPYPGAIAAGESTTLLLKLLNENGKAAAKGAAASVLFTTSLGKLSAKLGGADAEACTAGGGQTCRIATPATALTASNSDQIRLTVEHPGAGRSGAVLVRANVLASDGESFAAEPIRLIFSGSASAIALSAPTRGVLSHDTCDAPASDGPDGCKVAGDRDDRDVLTLEVTATDAAGNKVAVPSSGYGATKITGPDGKRVPDSAIAVTWPLRKDGDDAGAEIGNNDPLDTSLGGAPQAQLNVNAAQSAQLPAGEYTLELGVGALKASQTFSVSGAPASVTLITTLAELSVRDSFTVRARILDAGGAAVPDGTPVSWSATPIGAASTLVETASERRTTGGHAEASYLVVAPGRTSLRVAAGAAAELALIEVAGPPAPPIRLADLLASPNPLGSNIWFGDFFIRASALLRELPDADVVHVWQGNRWYRYSEVEGEQGEESIDFTIPPNAILWFGDDD